MNYRMIRVPSCMGARAIGVSSYSVAAVYSTTPGGKCEMLPVFREFLVEVCAVKIPQNDEQGTSTTSTDQNT